ncbi:unnamed protein product [Oikopleura dioica]|uniref:UBX domain-containing protein n=2 Tax=Oikopleura dioica TaxID=34765 RepID=E4X526_OIKDI|nr:unnamed protein product [Oikopleura dioica]
MDRDLALAQFQNTTWNLEAAIAEHFNPPEIEEVRPSRPPRVSREIKFIIHLSNGQDREVLVDEEVHVGTVLEIAKSNCNLRQDDPIKFTGWPTGGQPDNDLPLSILSLPSVVNLIHIDPNPAPLLPQATSRIHRLREERKDRHFTLKIEDTDQGDDHQLKYPGRKKIALIKDDVYSLTLIPPERQSWKGWPTSASDHIKKHTMAGKRIKTAASATNKAKGGSSKANGGSTSRQRAMKREQELVERQRVRTVSERERSNAKRLADKRRKAEAYKKKYAAEMQRRKKAGINGDLIQSNTDDWIVSTTELQVEFRRRFGDKGPQFFIGRLEDAAAEAYGSRVKVADRRLLAIYIHNEKSISANIFCSQILCSKNVSNFITANCVAWAFDMTNYLNRDRLLNTLDRMFQNGNITSQIRRMSPDQFPLVILSTGRSAYHEVLSTEKSNATAESMLDSLMNSVTINETRKEDDIKAEQERLQRENEVAQQESAYEQTLRADREKMEKLEAEKLTAERERQKVEKEERENLRKQQQAEDNLPPEPAVGTAGTCQLRFRLPDGRVLSRRFMESDRLAVLFLFIGAEGFHESNHRLIRQIPRADISALKRSKTLKEVGLKQDNLVVEANVESEEDESDDSEMEE